MRAIVFTLLFSFLLGSTTIAATTSWSIDPAHSSIGFKIKHMMISNVNGSFRGVEGLVVLDEDDANMTKVTATIDAISIDTGNDRRDEHLRSADFFDTEKYPTITFVSKQVKELTSSGFKLIGDFTLHGITKEVTLDVTGPSATIKDTNGNLKMAASATTEINRRDFGLNWSKVLEAGGLAVGEMVQIQLDIQLNKQ